ncbi:tRNA-splicing endonuclease subunit Sen34 [Hypsizygus marmoreus]|uniref:tRNA-splicing endonuclease subunit Sen34 n=1 Tax=Hypsizygus marmoreus TaxID=39966 RepID=A0A369JPV2_HYPMA|nr:tRNA-splicing endonuclease subunit Sen34 [Hypsizygus marmoreus]
MTGESGRIPLRIANKKAYVWDVDDIATIRSKHNICGILTGTLPHLSQQNAFLGVPLVLMPEEAVLLVENEIAVMIDDARAYPQPTLQQLQVWNLQQQEEMKLQLAVIEAKEAKESANSGRAMSAEALEKRRAREEKKAAQATRLAEASIVSSGPSALLVPEPAPSKGEATPPLASQMTDSSGAKGSTVAHTIVIPAASSAQDWYDPNPHSYWTIVAAKEAGIWDYPSNLEERAKCGAFRSLWEQGYFMGGGIKFGGDYLVYPGDPLRYHSHFAASVIHSPQSPLRPMEIVAHGRLGTATKKAHLLCSWDDDKKEVSYLTIEWAGFG